MVQRNPPLTWRTPPGVPCRHSWRHILLTRATSHSNNVAQPRRECYTLQIMADLGFGIGVLLVIFGPLLLIPIAWLVDRFAMRPIVVPALVPRVSAAGARWVSLALSILILGATLALSYFPGKREFDRLCSEHATPSISNRVHADGFYRTRLFAYEAKRFLASFRFVEAPDPYKDGVRLRYSKVGNDVRQEEVLTLRSRYGVREDFSAMAFGITMTEKHIYEMATSRELAKAAHITYEGGPLALFLGVSGMSACPDIRSEEGARDFQTFYNLETVILRGAETTEPTED